MTLEDIILIPVYVFVALILIRILHLDAWIDWFLRLFKIPNHHETRITALEDRVGRLEAQGKDA